MIVYDMVVVRQASKQLHPSDTTFQAVPSLLLVFRLEIGAALSHMLPRGKNEAGRMTDDSHRRLTYNEATTNWDLMEPFEMLEFGPTVEELPSLARTPLRERENKAMESIAPRYCT